MGKLEVTEPGEYTFAQFIGRGPMVLGEYPVSSRDVEEAKAIAPDGALVVHFHERAAAVVGPELLLGEIKNQSEGFSVRSQS